MKIKKITSGIISLLVVSASAVSAMSVSGADGNVKITASNETATAGSYYSLTVSLSDIPETGVQAADFTVTYDSSIVSVESVEAGALTQTGAETVDPTINMGLPAFSSKIMTDSIAVCFAVLTDDAQYRMQDEGVMFTIRGQVLDSAKDGDVAEFNIIPTPRTVNGSSTDVNDSIYLAYDSDSSAESENFVVYGTEVSAGSVTVKSDAPSDTTAAPTTSDTSASVTLKGDANLDGSVDIADAVCVAAYVGDSEHNSMQPQGLLNADVHGTGNGINASDALTIQQYLAGIIAAL